MLAVGMSFHKETIMDSKSPARYHKLSWDDKDEITGRIPIVKSKGPLGSPC